MDRRSIKSRIIALIVIVCMCFSTFLVLPEITYAGAVVELNIYANPGSAGKVKADDGTYNTRHFYDNGAQATVIAEANDGYRFIRWRNSKDETVSTFESYSFIITEDTDLTAEFKSEAELGFNGGTGTKSDPFKVDTAEQLFSINNYPDKYFKQTANIDLKNYTNVQSIGNSVLFTGNYDGNGKTIKNLTMHRPDAFDSALPESYYVGLFNIGEGGLIKDLTIENASIKATGTAGILAGINRGEIVNCHVEGNVSVTHNNQGAGGLVGVNSNLIWNCSAQGNVTGKNEIGGLVGKNTLDGTTGIIRDSYAKVTVSVFNCGGGLAGMNENGAVIETSFAKGTVNGDYTLGGLVGINNGEIKNCYATGEVNGADAGEIFGGFAAFNGGRIANSYSIGPVSGSTDSGGFAGINNDDGVIQNSFYNKETSGKFDEGKGTPKTTAELLTQATFTAWDFSTIWTKQSNTYPYLDWQSSNFPVAGEVLDAPALTLDSVGNHRVNLSWTQVTEATEYKIFQGTQTGNYTEVGATSALNYSIDELISGTTYYFAVKAFSTNRESLYSNQVSATPEEIITYSVTFTVADSENSPISGAAISIGSQEKLTDSYGTAVFQLPNGNYSYSVSKAGYITTVSIGLVINKDSMVPVTLSSQAGSENVSFKDENLKKMMLASPINADGNKEISREEALATTVIDSTLCRVEKTNPEATSYEIKSLAGLEMFQNLKTLKFTYTQYSNAEHNGYIALVLSDFNAIKDLANLEELIISGATSQINDKTALKDLSLKKLTMLNTELRNISFAAEIPSLEELNLSANYINTIAGISNLTNLKKLYLTANNIKDIEEISSIAGNLTTLALNHNPLNNANTPNCCHKSEKDFTVDGVTYEVWKQDTGVVDTLCLTVVNGEGSGIFHLNDTVTVKAKVPQGKSFGGWQNEEGTILTYSPTYAFRITRDITLTALFSDMPVKAVPTLILDDNVTYAAIDSEHVSMRILGTFVVPNGYQIKECGFISLKNSDPGLGLTLSTAGITRVNATKSLNQAGQVHRLIRTTYGAEFYVRGYLTYENSATGELETIYSANIVKAVQNK